MNHIDNGHVIDANASELAKERGIANAEVGSGPDWQAQAVALVKQLATSHPYIVADDLWASGLAETKEGRALGAVFIKAKRLGYIAPTMQFVLTHQVSRHRAPVRVWRSKLRVGGHFEESRLLSRVKASRTAKETMFDIANGRDES